MQIHTPDRDSTTVWGRGAGLRRPVSCRNQNGEMAILFNYLIDLRLLPRDEIGVLVDESLKNTHTKFE